MPDLFDFDPVEMTDDEDDGDVTLFVLPTTLAKTINREPNIIAGDLVGSMGIPLDIKPEDIDSTLNTCISKLEDLTNADDLAELMVMCSSHNFEAYRDAFYKIERHVFGDDPSSIFLEEGMVSKDSSIQLSFHMLRAYMRAEEGNFDNADRIWNELYPDWLDADEKKRTHFLLHLYMTNLCMNRWDDAFGFMKILWSTVKGMNASERHDYAAWDNWVCCLVVTWFFASHDGAFLQALRKEIGIYTIYYANQKKMILLKYLDPKFILELVSPQYYAKARSWGTNLPSIDTE